MSQLKFAIYESSVARKDKVQSSLEKIRALIRENVL